MLSLQSANFKNILGDITLEIKNGITMLAGKNGAGKTTLLKIMAGVENITGGRHDVDGVDWANLSSSDRARKISYLPQHADYAWPVKVSELASGEYVSALGLNDILNCRMDEISGGEKQRVMLANILRDKKTLLLLDEPLSSQDPEWRPIIMDLLKDISASRAIVMAMHDVGLMSLYADDVIWLAGGKIAGRGMSAEMVEKIFSVKPVTLEKDGRNCITTI